MKHLTRKLLIGAASLLIFPLAISCYSSTSFQGDAQGDDAADAQVEDTAEDGAAEAAGDCANERYLLGMASRTITCPREIRINQTAEIGFWGEGHSCGCGGYEETSVSWDLPAHGGPSSLDIISEEIICDPSLCCSTCRCVDNYDVRVLADYPAVGVYTNTMNGDFLCTTAVFGEDGCAHWSAGQASVADYTSLVFPADDSGMGTAVFQLSLSSGMCCNPAPIVTIVAEMPRDPSANIVNFTYPMINMCEGDCCYECACVDSFPMEVRVSDLSVGAWTVCFDGMGCYEVEVAGWL